MKPRQGDLALIRSGLECNIGKAVYVVGEADDPRLPFFGGRERPLLQVQMVGSPLLNEDGVEYLCAAIGADCLIPLDVPPEVAEAACEEGMARVFARAMRELDAEDADAEPGPEGGKHE